MKVAVVLLAISGIAFADPSPAELAAKVNDEGAQLMFAHDFKGATDKFRDAANRDPQAKYYFNLCTSLYQQGIFGAALAACNQVVKLQAPAALQAKTDKLVEKIKGDAAAQQISLDPVELTPEQAAAALAKAGKDAMIAGKYGDAAAKYREAIAKDPRAGYFYDLCAADYQAGRFDEALTACTAVAKHKPDASLTARADHMIAKLKTDASAQHIPLEPTPEPGSAADFAWQSDAQGLDLMRAAKYDDARVKFRDAVARDPQPRYFFNLCTANYQTGRSTEALDACNGVARNHGNAELRARADKAIAKIKEDAKAKGATPDQH